jgi:site-specific DNA-methyltransferase (adenine-specific)
MTARTGVSIDLLHGDCLDVMDGLIAKGLRDQVRTVFADPPYGLGRARWDKPKGLVLSQAFHEEWLDLARTLLDPDGTIWVSGRGMASHVVAVALARLNMPVISEVTVVKPTFQPNGYKRRYVWATESLLWAAARHGAAYRFDYEEACRCSGQRYAPNVWYCGRAKPSERTCGRHPTQKPFTVVERCLTTCTQRGDLVLDPFVGSGTSAVVAHRRGYRFIGIDQEREYLQLAERRLRAETCDRGSSRRPVPTRSSLDRASRSTASPGG